MKAFIYDMDGVIADTEPVHLRAEQRVLQKMGVEGVTLEFLMRYQGMTDLMMFEDMKKLFGFHHSAEQAAEAKVYLFNKIIHEQHVTPIEGSLELIRATNELRQSHGLKTAIASSSSDDFIAFVVDDLGIRDHFDLLMSGTNLPESKPNPAIYLQTAAYLRVDPLDCVVVEDAANGARAAKAAGMTCIGFNSPHSPNQDLSICDMLVDRLEEIDLSAF